MTAEVPKGWFVLMLEQLATQPALLDAAAAGPSEQWDRRRWQVRQLGQGVGSQEAMSRGFAGLTLAR